MQLNQVDTIDRHPVERMANLLACRCIRPLARLGCEEEAVTVLAEPGSESELGLAVARGSVDVIDPVLEQKWQRAICLFLRHGSERCRAEDHARARMSGRAEWSRLDHVDGVRGGLLPVAEQLGSW